MRSDLFRFGRANFTPFEASQTSEIYARGKARNTKNFSQPDTHMLPWRRQPEQMPVLQAKVSPPDMQDMAGRPHPRDWREAFAPP